MLRALEIPAVWSAPGEAIRTQKDGDGLAWYRWYLLKKLLGSCVGVSKHFKAYCRTSEFVLVLAVCAGMGLLGEGTPNTVKQTAIVQLLYSIA